MKPAAFFIISRFNEDISWIKNYTNNYLIYNKGKPIGGDYNVEVRENIGNNQGDMIYYIYKNYEKLPELMCFLQGNPFDHCKKELLDKLIMNTSYTSIEHYRGDGSCGYPEDPLGYYETNCTILSVIKANDLSTNQVCKYKSYDEFMNSLFEDYIHEASIKFPPGSQMIVEREKVLQYPKNFWAYLNTILYKNVMSEAHIMERAMPAIMNAKYKPKKELC